MPQATYGARLGAAALVGLLPALAMAVAAMALVLPEVVTDASDAVPPGLALGATALIANAVWAGFALATFVCGELLALFGEPTAWRVRGWALLPGLASLVARPARRHGPGTGVPGGVARADVALVADHAADRPPRRTELTLECRLCQESAPVQLGAAEGAGSSIQTLRQKD